MKKNFFYIFLLFVIGSGINVNAQTFTIPHDTITATLSGEAKFYNQITNVSSGPIFVDWKIAAHDFPADWQSSFALCDNNTCYSGSSLFDGTIRTTNSIAPSTIGEFYIWPDLSAASVGTHYAKINLSHGSYSKDSWYIFTKATTGVISASKAQNDVILYPNPSTNEINILHDSKLRVENILVCSADGRLMITTKSSGPASKIDVKNMPSGIYIVRLLNESGQITATSRFTRN